MDAPASRRVSYLYKLRVQYDWMWLNLKVYLWSKFLVLDFSKSKQHDQWKRGLNVVVNTADLVRQVCSSRKKVARYSLLIQPFSLHCCRGFKVLVAQVDCT